MVLAIDAERERISLGVKQLEQDPFSMYTSENAKGALVQGTVAAVDAKGAVITLMEGVEGVLKASELGRDRVEDASTVLKVGEAIEAKIINVDRKNRVITLSIRAKDIEDEQESLREFNRGGEESGATLGDLLKEKMETRDQ